MPIGMTLWQILVAAAASVLVGANIALLVEFGSRLASWWTFKLMAVSILLVYITSAMIYGNPAWWRTLLAAVAIGIDVLAFVRVYRAISSARRDQVELVIYTPRDT